MAEKLARQRAKMLERYEDMAKKYKLRFTPTHGFDAETKAKKAFRLASRPLMAVTLALC